ncbi:MAG: hypothetical protein M3N53_01955 [Actinomycetota bacterium]|nr:hypothetical protein [Actinomycetota bacterium]
MQAQDDDEPSPARARGQSIALVIAGLALVGFILAFGFFLVIRSLFDAVDPVNEMRSSLDEFPVPAGFVLVEERSDGGNLGFWGDRPDVTRFFEGRDSTGRTCETLRNSVASWRLAASTIAFGSRPSAEGPVCTISGTKDLGDGSARVHVLVWEAQAFRSVDSVEARPPVDQDAVAVIEIDMTR